MRQQHTISAVIDDNGQIIVPEELREYLTPGLQITLVFCQQEAAPYPVQPLKETFGTKFLRELKSEGILGSWGSRSDDFAEKQIFNTRLEP